MHARNGQHPRNGYIFCDYRATTESLFWYTKPQLRILRNTIYALHGYDFKSEDLKELFISWGKNWSPSYKVNPNFSEEELSELTGISGSSNSPKILSIPGSPL